MRSERVSDVECSLGAGLSAENVSVSTLRKFWRLSWRDRALLAEAIAWLALTSLLIAVLPFSDVAALASRATRRTASFERPEPPIVNRVRWAIAAASVRVPWRAVCFQQGLAAHLMLRRRAVRSALYYGASQRADTGLTAHVWVRAGDLDVVGCETASQYALLATFPDQNVEPNTTAV